MSAPLYPARTDRVMKARKTSTCPICRQYVTVGQQIGLTPVGWCHVGCIIAKARKLVST
jgi:hypothetical protein